MDSGDGQHDGDERRSLATAPDVSGQLASRARTRTQTWRPTAWKPTAWQPWLLWGSGLLLTGAGLFVLYLRQSMVAPFNADGASIMLQAQSMLHGNLLLHGWWAADVTFYSTEIPEYALVELVRGLRPDVVHISGALTYTLIVLLAALVARGRVKGRAGIVRALLAGGILLAPAIIGDTPVFLENPDHAGTAVPVLLMLLILDRAPERWYVPVAVGVLLAWVQVGDQLTLVAATAPVAAVAFVRMVMLGIRRRPLPEFRYDALLLVAAGASDELAKIAGAAVRHFGGVVTHPLPQQLIAPSRLFWAHARELANTLVLLFGANYQGNTYGGLAIVTVYHAIGLGLAGAGLAVGIVTFFFQRTDRVSQILVASTLAVAAAGVVTTELPSLSHAHEVAILLPFGAVLAGRMLPDVAPGLVPARWHRWRAGRVAAGVLAVWLASGLALLCFAANWRPLPPPQQTLATWLAGHGYTDGLAAYWQANSTTVTSGGKVLVAPITASADAVRHWEAWSSWYGGSHSANFVVASANPGTWEGALNASRVRKSFGRPEHQYTVGKYVILVYDYNLLTKLRGRSFPN